MCCKVPLEQALLIWEFLPGQICSVQRFPKGPDKPHSCHTTRNCPTGYWFFSRPKSKQIHLLFSFTESSDSWGFFSFLFQTTSPVGCNKIKYLGLFYYSSLTIVLMLLYSLLTAHSHMDLGHSWKWLPRIN